MTEKANIDTAEIYSDSTNSTEASPEEKQPFVQGQLEAATMLLDIQTASYADLIDMCNQLGLSVQGDIETIRRRIADYYKLPTDSLISVKTNGTSQRTISIQSAQKSETVSMEQSKNMVRLTGNVSVAIRDELTTSTINAQEIQFDRDSNLLFARGEILFEQKGSGGDVQTFKGDALLFDIEKMNGVFLDGITKYDPGNNSDSFIISAKTIGRDSKSTMVFDKGTLTTCDAENPHWKISASRIWLLPGNEFAILNGVLFVGSLPVFYIPFLYYPTDEMIIHPVFGKRSREGYFIQTTSYLIGRKKVTSSGDNNLINLFQSDSNMEQVRSGLFFRNTDKVDTSTSTDYLKIMADVYSSLGGMIALDGSFTPSKSIPNISFFAAIGLSRTLVPLSDGSYSSLYTGESDWNSSNFLGFSLPFRYHLNYKMKLSFPYLALQFDLPIVSDQYFTSDFMNRSEDLNWLSLLMSSDREEETVSSLSSLKWSISGSATIPVKKFSPWVESASFSSISSSVSLYSKTDTQLSASIPGVYDPERTFFYPSSIIPLNAKMSFSGTLLSSSNKSSTEKKYEQSSEIPIKLVSPLSLEESNDKLGDVSKKDSDNQTENNQLDNLPSSIIDSNQESALKMSDFFPTLSTTFSNSNLSTKPSWKLGYTVSPFFSSELKYDPSLWTNAESVDWSKLASSYLSSGGDATLSGYYSLSPWLSTSSSIVFSGVWSDHPFLSSEYYKTDSSIQTVKKSDYQSTKLTLTAKDSISIKPLSYYKALSNTSLSWNFSGKLLRSVYNNDVESPNWDFKTIEWTTTAIDTHTAAFILSGKFLDFDQNVSVTANLPPRDSSWTGSITTGVTNLYTTVQTRYYEKTNSDEWVFDPLNVSLYWKPFNKENRPVFKETLIFELNDSYFSSFVSSMTWGNFSMAYKMIRSVPYTFSESEGEWKSGSTESFLPSNFSLSYSNTLDTLYFWKNRIQITPGLTTSLNINLLRVTESSFSFSPTIKLSIFKNLVFSFSSLSTNSVIARYFDKIPLFGLPDLPGEENPIKDLLQSFYFWDKSARQASGFKLKSLSFSLTQDLHDWDLSADLTVKPVLQKDAGNYHYEYIPYFSFVISWKPVSDVKTTIKSERGNFELNP